MGKKSNVRNLANQVAPFLKNIIHAHHIERCHNIETYSFSFSHFTAEMHLRTPLHAFPLEFSDEKVEGGLLNVSSRYQFSTETLFLTSPLVKLYFRFLI